MILRDIMTHPVAAIDSNSSAREAALRMTHDDVGFLVVTHEGVCAGVVTDRDIMTRVVAPGLNAEKTPVSSVMTRGIPGVSRAGQGAPAGIAALPEEAAVEEALNAMDQLHVRRVLVYNEDKHITGVVSRSDIPHATVAGRVG